MITKQTDFPWTTVEERADLASMLPFFYELAATWRRESDAYSQMAKECRSRGLVAGAKALDDISKDVSDRCDTLRRTMFLLRKVAEE